VTGIVNETATAHAIKTAIGTGGTAIATMTVSTTMKERKIGPARRIRIGNAQGGIVRTRTKNNATMSMRNTVLRAEVGKTGIVSEIAIMKTSPRALHPRAPFLRPSMHPPARLQTGFPSAA
jgi:hypothetical protein